MKNLKQNETIERIKNLSNRLRSDMKNESLATSLKININKITRFTACGCDPLKILAKADDVVKQYEELNDLSNLL